MISAPLFDFGFKRRFTFNIRVNLDIISGRNETQILEQNKTNVVLYQSIVQLSTIS